ncbi:energy-coupling factor transporter transmembrane component T [Eubacteriaceae bacterium ES3]|nr:energy-coupling factor transporter transmembrane component T [Eubacteriaceae bacterium ES3]
MMDLKNWDSGLKFVLCLLTILIGLISQNIYLNTLLIIVILFMELVSERSLKAFKTLAILILIVASQVLVINIFFGRSGQIIYTFGILRIYSGFLMTTLQGTLKISIISLSAFQFAIHTESMDMAQTLIQWKIPYRYAMLVPMIDRFLPVMINEYKSISNSQSARGVPNDIVLEKIKNLPSSILPLIYRALRISSDAALSAELRGYGRYQTRSCTQERVLDISVDYGDK